MDINKYNWIEFYHESKKNLDPNKNPKPSLTQVRIGTILGYYAAYNLCLEFINVEFGHDHRYINNEFNLAVDRGEIKDSSGSHKAVWFYFHKKNKLEKIYEIGNILRECRTKANYHDSPFYLQDADFIPDSIEELFRILESYPCKKYNFPSF